MLVITGSRNGIAVQSHPTAFGTPAELPFAFAFGQPGGAELDDAGLAGAGAVARTTGGHYKCEKQSCQGQQQGSHVSHATGRLAASLPRSWCVTHNSCQSPSSGRDRAGLPAASERAGTSRVATLPEAIRAISTAFQAG